MTKRRKGTFWFVLGILFILASVALTGYNIYDEKRAESVKGIVLTEIVEKTVKKEHAPNVEKFPDIAMPVETIQGEGYIGMLEVPSLGLQLPVMSEWSYPQLKISPCRYVGSAYKGDLVIAAHNYDCHFGRLKSLFQGDEVRFIDMDGNEFVYDVVEIEILEPTAIEEMVTGDWDLTLFTCTYGGQTRVTVRCIKR